MRGWNVRAAINEHIYELAKANGAEAEFLCECSGSCPSFVKLTLAQFEAARAAGRLILASGHAAA